MATSLTVRTKDGIEWYCEHQGHGPDLILVPSGEGDCASFTQVATLLANSFKVTTFDMPGMSRSTAPDAALHELSAYVLATQIVSLMDELSIDVATFYGCSSGGLVVLALAANYSGRVRSAIVHEVPLGKKLSAFTTMDDATIVDVCRRIFATEMVEDNEAWTALGPAYHARLDRNYVTWVRNYVDKVERTFSKAELNVRPVDWTVGALTPMGAFFENVTTASQAGIPIGLLPSRHFPQVTIPAVLAEHIRMAATKHL